MGEADADVTVVGGGMAGLVATVSSLEAGADTTLVEKGPELGGSMALSGGNVWTHETMDDVRAHVAGGDRSLQRLLVERLPDGWAWLEARGVELASYEPFQGHGRQCEPAQLIEALRGEIARAGGTIRCSTAMEGLADSEGNGGLTVAARDVESGDPIEFETRSVVLATGGFQGSEALVRQYIAGDRGRYVVRANPESDGAGLRAGRAVGADLSGRMDQFYGHNLVATPERVPAERFMDASQYFGPVAVALDEDGERFTDESARRGEEHVAGETLRLADGRAVYVVDSRRHGETYQRPVETMLETAREFGGNVAEEPDLRALGDRLDGWGFDGEAAVRTVTAFNEAIEAGRADALDPPRSAHRWPIDAPPIYAVEVEPGVTFTGGGLRVDGRMRVLGEGGPIGGRWAAGVDVGGIHDGGYMGGLSTGLVTGRIAGRNAGDAAR